MASDFGRDSGSAIRESKPDERDFNPHGAPVLCDGCVSLACGVQKPVPSKVSYRGRVLLCRSGTAVKDRLVNWLNPLSVNPHESRSAQLVGKGVLKSLPV